MHKFFGVRRGRRYIERAAGAGGCAGEIESPQVYILILYLYSNGFFGYPHSKEFSYSPAGLNPKIFSCIPPPPHLLQCKLYSGFHHHSQGCLEIVCAASIMPFGPDYAEKRRRMGPGGRFCHSDNAPQDGDSAGAAGVAHSRRRHPAPNARPRYPLRFFRQQPSNRSRRRSRPVHFGDIRQPIHHIGLRF